MLEESADDKYHKAQRKMNCNVSGEGRDSQESFGIGRDSIVRRGW